jgi:hypothetical protein
LIGKGERRERERRRAPPSIHRNARDVKRKDAPSRF